MRRAVLVLILSFAYAQVALAEGDIVAGKTVFAKCSACHSADQPKNRVGPTLMGVVGRHAAAVADYSKYSPAMKKAGSDGLVWNEKTLTLYLANPKGVVPGTKMIFSGLKSETDVSNVIAFLKSVAAP